MSQGADVIDTVPEDTRLLLAHLGIYRLPYMVQGMDFPFVADVIAHHPGLVSEVIGVGARACLPDGTHAHGAGRWQRFFVSTAPNASHLVKFASRAAMTMSQRLGAAERLRRLCKDSPSDMALLEQSEMRGVLCANLELMAGGSSNAALSFASEFIAFQREWSPTIEATVPAPM